MTQRPKKLLLLPLAFLSIAAGAQADDGFTVYGRDGSTFQCTFVQEPIITFSKTGLSIKTKSGTMPEKPYSSVAKIDFNVRRVADVNGDGRVDIADVLSVINTNVSGTNVKKDVNRDGKVDNADVKAIIDEQGRLK